MAITRLMTVEEFEQLNLDGRYELIDGELVEMPPSGGASSSSGVRISTHLSNHVTPRGLGTVYGADGGFVLFPDRQMVRVPDVAFVRADRLPAMIDQDGFLRLAPDLAVEVLSPFDRRAEVEAKVALYLEAGVRLVWVVDPRERTVAVHAPGVPVRILHAVDENDGGAVLPDFRAVVADFFPFDAGG